MIRIPGLALRSPVVSLLLAMALCSGAHAQGVPQPGVQAAIKTSNNPQQIRPAVQEFMNAQVTALGGTDADPQTKARNALVSEATLMQGAVNAATAVYADVYAQELGQRLEALAKDAKATARTRLNAAIVLAYVAQATSNPQLKNATIALLGDPSEAVVIWALKAARPLLPVVLKQPLPDTKFVLAIVAAAKKFPKGNAGGAVTMEAYYALTLDISDANKARLITAPMHKAVAPAILDLLAFRVGLYQRGIPPEVRAERIPTFYLTDANAWNNMSAQQQQLTMQLIVHLLVLAAEQAKGPDVPQEDRRELAITIGVAARSMSRAAQTAGAAEIVTALRPATDLANADVARLGLPGDEIAKRVAGVYAALKANAKFAGVAPPPAVIGREQAPPPASAPTTGQVDIPGVPTTPPPGAPAPATPAPPIPAPAAPGTPAPAAPGGPTNRTPPAAPGGRPGATPPAATPPGATPPGATPPGATNVPPPRQ